MRYFLLFIWLCCGATAATGQKMLLIEKANEARTEKLYPGDQLIFRLKGEENYWYERTITDILPESNSLMLDNYLVKLDDIGALKVHRKGVVRVVGGALLSLGISLGVAITAAALYQDWDHNFPVLIGTSISSFFAGRYLLKRKKITMGEKYRLRIIEIKFEDSVPPRT